MSQPSKTSTSMTNVTTEQIQQYLEENEKLIYEMMEFQNRGRIAESEACQNKLQQNLTFLAGLADVQTQETEPATTVQASPQTAGKLEQPAQPHQADPLFIQQSGSHGPNLSSQQQKQKSPALQQQKQKSPKLQQQKQKQKQKSPKLQQQKQKQKSPKLQKQKPKSPALQQQQQQQFQASAQAAGQLGQHVQPYQAAAMSIQQSGSLGPNMSFQPNDQKQFQQPIVQQQQHQFQPSAQAAGQLGQHVQPYQAAALSMQQSGSLGPNLSFQPNDEKQFQQPIVQQQQHQFQPSAQAAGQLGQHVQPYQAAALSMQQSGSLGPNLSFQPNDQKQFQQPIVQQQKSSALQQQQQQHLFQASSGAAGQLGQRMQPYQAAALSIQQSGSLGPNLSFQPNDQMQFQQPIVQQQKSSALQQHHQFQASSGAAGQLGQRVQPYQAAALSIQQSGSRGPNLSFQPNDQKQFQQPIVQQQQQKSSALQQQHHQFRASAQAAGQLGQRVQPYQAAASSIQQSGSLGPNLSFQQPNVSVQQQQQKSSALQQQLHQLQASAQAAGQLEQHLQPSQAAASSRRQLHSIDAYLYFPPDNQEQQQRRLEQRVQPFRSAALARQQSGNLDSYLYVQPDDQNQYQPPIIQQQHHQLLGLQQQQQQQQQQLSLLQEQQLTQDQVAMGPVSPTDIEERMAALQFADTVLNIDGSDKEDD